MSFQDLDKLEGAALRNAVVQLLQDDVNVFFAKQDLNSLSTVINYWIRRQGFWSIPQDPCDPATTVAVKLSKHALITTEVAELTEAVRHGNPPSEHIPEFSAEEEELADIIIRVLDYAGQFNLRIGNAVLVKMMFNLNRPFKHGKEA